MPVTANPIDLTTLANVKAWLAITGSQQDDILQRTITAVSRFILTFLSRSVLPANYSDRYDGAGSRGVQRIMLKNWPVISVSSVFLGSTAIAAAPIPGPGVAWGSGYLLSPGDDFPPGSQQWLDFHGDFLCPGGQNVGVSYRAGYATSETWAIPGSPYQITPNALLGMAVSDEGVTIDGVAAVRVATAPMAGQYSISYAASIPTYLFNVADTGKTAVLTYGYVPQDLSQAAMEMIAFRVKSKEWIGLVSKSLGGQETVSFSQKDMPDYVSTALQSYKRVF
jgi:hypothetical protein